MTTPPSTPPGPARTVTQAAESVPSALPSQSPEPPSGIVGWLESRLSLSSLRYAIPAHANTVWYTLGGVTFVGIVVLVVTGTWLVQYYNPDPAGARSSVQYIQNEAPLGDIVRGIHIWVAYLVVLTAVAHLIRVFVTASYKIPREVNWYVGLALLALLVGNIFTGTILRWDQEAYEAMTHNMQIASFLGALGGFFSNGFTTSVGMVPRLYAAHVSIIPLLIALLLIAHFFQIKVHAISPTPRQADAGQAPGGKLPKARLTANYSRHLRVMVGLGLVLLAVAGVLSLLWPQPIGAAPNPALEVTKPSFVFYFMYPFENWFGVIGILYGGVVFFGLLALVPILDHGPWRSPRRRPFTMALGALLLLAVIALSLMTWLEPPAKHLGS